MLYMLYLIQFEIFLSYPDFLCEEYPLIYT